MCDVDDEAVVAAVDAPSIYDIPKVLHTRGPRRLRRAPARPAVPRRRLDRRGTTCCDRVHHPDARGHGRAGRQVHRPARRLPVGHRGAAGRRLRQRRQGQDPLGPSDDCETPDGRRAAARRRRRRAASPAASASAASRARSARSGTPASTASRRSGCAWACSAWSSRSPATSAGLDGRQLHGVRRRARRTRSSPRWPTRSDVVAGEGDLGGTMRLGALPGRSSREGSIVARGVRRAPRSSERHRHRYEVNNAYRDAARAGRPASSPAPRRTAAWSSSSSCRATCTRTSSPPRPTRSCGRRPTRPHPLFAGLVGGRHRTAQPEQVELPESPRRRRRALHRPPTAEDATLGSVAGRTADRAGSRPVDDVGDCARSRRRVERPVTDRSMLDARDRRSTATSSCTPARSACSRSTTRTGCCCSGSTGTRSRHTAVGAAGRAARRRRRGAAWRRRSASWPRRPA